MYPISLTSMPIVLQYKKQFSFFHAVTDTDTTKRRRIPKSRYDSISSYLSECNTACPEARYNDISLVHDEAIYNILREAGIQEHMAKHVAHLFIR